MSFPVFVPLELCSYFFPIFLTITLSLHKLGKFELTVTQRIKLSWGEGDSRHKKPSVLKDRGILTLFCTLTALSYEHARYVYSWIRKNLGGCFLSGVTLIMSNTTSIFVAPTKR